MDSKKGQNASTTTQTIFTRLSRSKEDDIDQHNQKVVTAYKELLTFMQDLERQHWPADEAFFNRVTEIFLEACLLVNSFTNLLLHFFKRELDSSRNVSIIQAISNTSLKRAFEQYQANNQAHHFQNPVIVSQDMHEVYRALNQLGDQLHELVIPPLSNSELTRRLNITCEIFLNYVVLLKRIQQKIENYHFDYQRKNTK